MKRSLDGQTSVLPNRTAYRPWLATLVALLWVAAGIAALLILCAVGPAIIEYVTGCGLPVIVLAPLVSVMIAVWDAGGLMLVWFGLGRLVNARRPGNDL